MVSAPKPTTLPSVQITQTAAVDFLKKTGAHMLPSQSQRGQARLMTAWVTSRAPICQRVTSIRSATHHLLSHMRAPTLLSSILEAQNGAISYKPMKHLTRARRYHKKAVWTRISGSIYHSGLGKISTGIFYMIGARPHVAYFWAHLSFVSWIDVHDQTRPKALSK